MNAHKTNTLRTYRGIACMSGGEIQQSDGNFSVTAFWYGVNEIKHLGLTALGLRLKKR